MPQKNLKEIAELWKEDKKQYVKKSTYAAYVLLIQNHIIPTFGDDFEVEESKVQEFVLKKIQSGLSEKTVKDILIVLKMILKFGEKNHYIVYKQIDIVFPTVTTKKELDVLTKTDQKKISKLQAIYTPKKAL